MVSMQNKKSPAYLPGHYEVSKIVFLYLCLMHIDILTVLPELLESPFQHSMMKRAQEKGLLTIQVHQLRKWAINEYGMVDDYQFGGGAGMLMMCEPLANAIEHLQSIGTQYGQGYHLHKPQPLEAFDFKHAGVMTEAA